MGVLVCVLVFQLKFKFKFPEWPLEKLLANLAHIRLEGSERLMKL